MNLKDKVVVVTGGADGIGRALCRRFAMEGVRAIVVADVNGDGANRLAKEVGGLAVTTDVGNEAAVRHLVGTTLQHHGTIDLFCSNAGIVIEGGTEVPDDKWQRIWQINVMAHVYAARAVLPGMLGKNSCNK